MSSPLASKKPKIKSAKHPDTGEDMYTIAGRYPMYFHNLLLETRELAEEAKSEAEEVLNTRERPEGSKFLSAYLKKGNPSNYKIIRE